MRFPKFRLPLWVAGGLLTATVSAAEPTAPSPLDDLSTSLAQADAGVPPVMPNVPQEDVYQYRGLPPQEAAQESAPADEEGPTRYLETEFLTKRGINTYGWIDVGIGANNWGYPYNGPVTFNDRNWEGQMNQLYLVNEKTLDLEDGGFDWGGRVDLLYGTDYLFTTARGLDAHRFEQVDGLGIPRWDSNRYYGLAMPQLYAEVGYGRHAVKFGHFYTIIGYEVVPAIGNFFYTHAYTMQYGEPFTHTGILDTFTVNDQLTIYAGITNGWDNWDDGMPMGSAINPGYPGANSNAAFLGGATFKSSDERQALTVALTTGNEYTPLYDPITLDYDGSLIGNRTMVSVVYINELSDKLTYVFQTDNGWQANAGPIYQTAGQDNDTARWFGVNQYLFWNFTDTLIGGLRFEWFSDLNGYRVFNPLRNAASGGSPIYGPHAGNFWEMTWGLNWKPGNNWIVRPELRYDWFDGVSPNGSPFGAGNRNDQFYGGCDVIWQF